MNITMLMNMKKARKLVKKDLLKVLKAVKMANKPDINVVLTTSTPGVIVSHHAKILCSSHHKVSVQAGEYYNQFMRKALQMDKTSNVRVFNPSIKYY